jgi:ribonuclease HI
MPWKKYEFKGQTVYVRVLPTGKPIVHRGRVELRYKLGARKSYKASPEGITPIEGEDEIIADSEMSGNAGGAAAATAALRETPTTPADDQTIVVYTDGACSGNPGPAGIGVLLQRPEQTVEISEFLGSGTNNIAELTAILRALETLEDDEQDQLIHLYTDSGWSLGVLVGGWKAKANLELIEQIRTQLARFPKLELLKVRGHAGHPGNEEADRLATQATRREASSEPRIRRRRR